ncbi:MAG: adenylate/guanylate cyclase domain-containing protein [Gammaproteobacteria bacterium]|nr:adenylate/guanylate cyclase domain-containing protein [Gammaproteobacteria bacterium]NIR83382.1 adenylate/guanylate cyclase domain-containing protein [Gammaproteobacteria bacterium]
MLSGLVRRGDGEVIQAALWFSDLRDFTRLTESLRLEELLALLNTYFEQVTGAVRARGGEVLRFAGDAVLAVFPVDEDRAARHACNAALEAAFDVLSGLAALGMDREARGEPAIRCGIGLDVGEVIYGNVGAPDRLEFTVMGAVVNRAARLEKLTKKLEEPVILSADFAARVNHPLRSLGAHELKGAADPQQVFAPKELAMDVD